MLPLLPLDLGMVPMDLWGSITGFFETVMWPIYWAVSGLLVLFHYLWSPVLGADSGWTWSLSIVSLTVVIRAALIPLFIRQIQSSRNMQALQPKVRELQKKYGHDREALGRETMKLYRENNANPMASCLPLLLQMPIFITLFQVINHAAIGDAAGKFLEDRPELVSSLREATIFDGTFLQARISDKFLPFSGFNGVTVLTVLLILGMSATMFYTQLQLTRKNMPPEALEGPMAQQQKMMLYLFPVIFAVGGVNFPIGVLIYWLTSNLWTTGQQFFIIKRNPTPGTPAYAEWEAKQRLKGRDPSAGPGKKKSPQGSRTVGDEAVSTEGVTVSDGPRVQRQAPRQQPQRQSRSQRKKKR
ncbi:MAG TPA: membrane protein insertase YidC [Candidatus Avipropionibacterium avicola]|uniref:Membrane protein insertase YidC n=1 Tax=Candidatus Avipropionibacterium avicola TaxID=2840701 RepID=A0A9D1GYW4_9ACTN|nr:membrane protein insertase YidC [Candidatus Avipropionibacterium avicola]